LGKGYIRHFQNYCTTAAAMDAPHRLRSAKLNQNTRSIFKKAATPLFGR
jgi:hypothetical protein